jgi:Ca2+:H+ antiporter
MPRWLYFLLVFAVLAPILELVHAQPLFIFIVAALGIVPLAALIGDSVEGVAEHTGERIGGLLFATFGNATELIIGILALSQGLVDVVRASIIGTILGNTLLVLGVSVCVGGFKHGRLKFEARPASQYASLFALCVASLALPTVAELLATRGQQTQIVERGVLLSDFVAVLLLVGYISFILFSVFHVGDEGEEEEGEGEGQFAPVLGAYSVAAITRLVAYRRELMKSSIAHKSGMLRQIDGTVSAIVAQEADKQAAAATIVQPEPVQKPPLWRSILFLSLATIGVAILSEILVGAIEPVTTALGWNPAFVGLVFLPLIGGLPEYFNTISMSLDKRMGMVLAASAGSSIQIALLVAPILVLLSIFMQKRLDLVFNIVELAVLGLATFLFSEITKDGELVWLEGLLLILLYAMMAGTVFLFG